MKKTKKSKKTVAVATAKNTETSKSTRGRPAGTGNYLTSVAEIVRMTGVKVPKAALTELNKHHVPLIQSVIKKASLNSKKTPFVTNKSNLETWYSRYTSSPAIKSIDLGS